MSFGKLVIKLEVLDPSIIGDEDNVFSKPGRKVTMFSKCCTKNEAETLAMAFVETNINPRSRSDLEVYWYPDPVRIGSWHF